MSAAGYIVGALTGGLAGSALTLSIQSFLRWRSRPILEIVFQRKEPGCDVETQRSHDEHGKPLLHEGKPIEVKYRYLRLKLKNSGRTFAANCSLCITEIEFSAPGQGRRVFEEEVLDLGLALTGPIAFNLAAKGHRFLDVVRTHDDPRRRPHLFGLTVEKIPERLGPQMYGAGRYKMKVFAAANNAASVSYEIEWSYDGSAGGLQILSCRALEGATSVAPSHHLLHGLKS
jgi:hypothetical protein